MQEHRNVQLTDAEYEAPDFGQLAEDAQAREWFYIRWIAAAVILSIVVIIVAVKITTARHAATAASRPVRISISSTDSHRLEDGAPVLFGNVHVGHVVENSIVDGQPVALLEIDPKFFGQLTADNVFTVTSMNSLMPGNIGVRISPARSAAPTSPPLLPGSNIRGQTRFLPASTPVGFYLASFAIIAGLVILLIILWRSTKAVLLLMAVAVIVAGGFYLCGRDDLRGKILDLFQAPPHTTSVR